MSILVQIILASGVVSAIALVAVFGIVYGKQLSRGAMKSLIGVASGVLLASVFLELLPEVFEETDIEPHAFFPMVLAGILLFYLVERLIHWHHCHGENCPPAASSEGGRSPENKIHVAVTNLLGDGIHNFVDGILIGAAFLVSPEVGIATTLAIIAHEIPQELSDAGILLYAGLSKAKVIAYNCLFALTSMVGALASYFFVAKIEKLIPVLVALAAGNFIYLALADLIPELHHERISKNVMRHTLWLFVGVGVFWFTTLVIGGH